MGHACWSVWTKKTSLVGSPVDNLIVDDAQQDGQIWVCENAFLRTLLRTDNRNMGRKSEGDFAAGHFGVDTTSPFGVDQCGLEGWIIQCWGWYSTSSMLQHASRNALVFPVSNICSTSSTVQRRHVYTLSSLGGNGNISGIVWLKHLLK